MSRWPDNATGACHGALVALLGAACLSLALSGPLTAQDVQGVVIRADSTPVAGVLVELHRITETSGSVADSTLSDPVGRFRFVLRDDEDSGAVFLPSARHDGILYWGSPIHGISVESDPTVQYVTVFDTTAVSGPLPDQSVALRHVVLTPTASGLQVEEVIDLPGRGDRTFVAAVDGSPLWSGLLARNAHGLLTAQGGVPPEDLELGNGVVALAGVLPLAGVRVAVSYFVPSRHYELEIGHPTRRMDVLVVEVPGLAMEATGLSESPVEQNVGVPVRRFTATDLEPGARVSVEAVIEEEDRKATWIWFAVALVLGVAALASARLGRTAPRDLAAGGRGR